MVGLVRKPAAMAVLLVSLLAAGWEAAAADEVPARIAAVEQVKAYSGEEIFRGVFFGEGDVARLFPEYDYSVFREKPELGEAADALVDAVNARSPAFWEDFGAKLRSGNPWVVRDAVVGLGDKVHEIVSEPRPNTPPTDLTVVDPGMGSDVNIFLYTAAHVAVALEAAAEAAALALLGVVVAILVFVIFLVFVLVVPVAVASVMGELTPLALDELAGRIARRLHSA